MFNEYEKGTKTFEIISRENSVPESTLKGRYYKYKQDPEGKGFLDRRFAGLANKS